MLPANPSLGEIAERARVIKKRAYRLYCEGTFDQAAEQKAVLELARLIALRAKIEASRPVKKRRRKATRNTAPGTSVENKSDRCDHPR